MDGVMVVERLVAEDLDIGTGVTRVTAPSGGTFQGHQMNISVLGTAVTGTWTPGAMAAGATSAIDVTVNGVTPGAGYIILAGFGLATQGCILSAWVNSNDTVRVQFYNPTGLLVTLGSGTLNVVALPFPASNSLMFRPGS